MAIFYIPDNVPANYKYLIRINSNYYELSNVPFVNQNSSYNFVRIYNNNDYYTEFYQSSTGYNTLNFNEVSVSNDFLCRNDVDKILIASFIIIYFIIFLCNIVTRVVKRGGLFSNA